MTAGGVGDWGGVLTWDAEKEAELVWRTARVRLLEREVEDLRRRLEVEAQGARSLKAMWWEQKCRAEGLEGLLTGKWADFDGGFNE